MNLHNNKRYWIKNVRYLSVLLTIWFIAAFILPILTAPLLNRFSIGGFKLGFWFAQQGSIIIFVILVFVYVLMMNKLDEELDANNEKGPS